MKKCYYLFKNRTKIVRFFEKTSIFPIILPKSKNKTQPYMLQDIKKPAFLEAGTSADEMCNN
jgi:hypothetical protein